MAFLYFPIEGAKATSANVSSNFGRRSVEGGSTYHHGIDLAYNVGTNCLAALNGTVVENGVTGQARGNYIVLDCGTYEPYGRIYLYYQHMLDSPAAIGTKFTRGDVCGRVGQSGQTATSFGAHLHFGISINSQNDYYSRTCERYDDYPQITIGAVDPATATWLGIDNGEDVSLLPNPADTPIDPEPAFSELRYLELYKNQIIGRDLEGNTYYFRKISNNMFIRSY